MDKKPILIIINGLPGAGKTTLSRRISEQFHFPLFSKDAFKEIFFKTLGIKDRSWSMELGKTAISTMLLAAESTLKKGVPCIIESPFQPHFGQKDIENLLKNAPAEIIQIFCSLPPQERIQRLLHRVHNGERHPGHQDPDSFTAEEYAVLVNTELDPMDIEGRLLHYDSTRENAYEELLSALQPIV